MAFGFGSPQSANQLAALGAMQGAMPAGSPMQSMAPVIPSFQGGGGGMMMPMMPGMPAPQRPQQGQNAGASLMNPQLIAMLKKAFNPAVASPPNMYMGGAPGGTTNYGGAYDAGTGFGYGQSIF